jgi:hypothetical protein
MMPSTLEKVTGHQGAANVWTGLCRRKHPEAQGPDPRLDPQDSVLLAFLE